MRRLVTIFLVMSLGVASLWALIDRMRSEDITGEPVAPVTATAAITPEVTLDPALEGTPPPDEATLPRPGSLPDLLRYAPDRLSGGGLPLTDVGQYADISAWMDEAGVALPAGLDDPALAAWDAQLANLAIPASLEERGLDPIWAQTYGFSLLDVTQVLIVGNAPDYVMVMRGGFEATAIQDAWVRNGYQAVEIEGTTIWSLYPQDAIDLSAPASRPSMGALNNVTLLPDGTLVAAARLSRMESALEAIRGNADSLADNGMIASLLDSLMESGDDAERFVSAVISSGELLRVLPSGLPVPDATPVVEPKRSITDQALHRAMIASELIEMPPVDLVVIGVVAADDHGGTPAANATAPEPPMVLRMILSIDGIERGREAREAVWRRLAESVSPVTQAPYRSRLGDPRIILRDVPGDRVTITIDATLRRGAGDWLDIIEQRDLGFAMWIGPADDPGGGN